MKGDLAVQVLRDSMPAKLPFLKMVIDQPYPLRYVGL